MGFRALTPEERATFEGGQASEQDRLVAESMAPGISPQESGRLLSEAGLDTGEVKPLISDKATRIILELAGMVSGSGAAVFFLGSRLAGPISRLALRLGGAGGGGAVGSLVAETVDPSEKPIEEAGKAAAIGMGGELIGAGVAAAGSKIIAPFRKNLMPGAQDAIDVVTEGGGVLPADRLVDSNLSSLITNVADAAFIGGKQFTRTGRAAIDIVESRITALAEGFGQGASKEEVGVIIQNAIDGGTSTFRAATRSAYARVDDLAQGVTVDIGGLRGAAQALRERLSAGIPSEGTMKVLDNILGRNNQVMSFADASILRSDLLAISRGGTELIPGQAQGAAKQLASALDTAMDRAAKVFTGGAEAESPQGAALVAEWRAANEMWQVGKEQFNSRLIMSLANSQPEVVFNTAIKNQRPGTIRRVREIVAKENPDAWSEIQGQFLKDLIVNSTKQGEGSISGTSLLNRLRSFGDDSLKELIPDEAVRVDIKRLFGALASVQSKEPGFGLAIQMTQAGTMVAVALPGGPGLGAAAGTMLLPGALGKILTTKNGARWLTTGLTAPPGSAAATDAIAKLTALIQTQDYRSVEAEKSSGPDIPPGVKVPIR